MPEANQPRPTRHNTWHDRPARHHGWHWCSGAVVRFGLLRARRVGCLRHGRLARQDGGRCSSRSVTVHIAVYYDRTSYRCARSRENAKPTQPTPALLVAPCYSVPGGKGGTDCRARLAAAPRTARTTPLRPAWALVAPRPASQLRDRAADEYLGDQRCNLPRSFIKHCWHTGWARSLSVSNKGLLVINAVVAYHQPRPCYRSPLEDDQPCARGGRNAPRSASAELYTPKESSEITTRAERPHAGVILDQLRHWSQFRARGYHAGVKA